uniref:Pleurotolysin B C-terminal domain-containing protein n=1 Tax=Moniliophthora roreri TaxID=221103 RepID=A0A0W0FQC7_MONRR
MFPQGQIDFTVSGSGFVDAVQLNPEFLSAIDSALDKSTPPEKRDALYNGFQEYGQVFRDKVQIGGVLSAHTMDTFSKTTHQKFVDVERVPNTTQYPKDIYQPKDAIPSGWFWLGHTANATQALIVESTFPLKVGRNPCYDYRSRELCMTDQPTLDSDLAQYQFLSTYFGGGSYVTPPSRWELYGDSIGTSIYVTWPAPPVDPDEECFDLQSVARVKLPSGSPPKPRWALKSVVWLDSGEY